MRKTYKILASLLLATFFVSCDAELERLPKDQITIPTAFTNYSTVQTYAWSFYEAFGSYGYTVGNEHAADLMFDGRNLQGSDWLWNRIVVPTNSNNYTIPYQRIRKVNIMLDNLDKSDMSEKEIAHWKSVGYFFRSWNYFELLSKYGGVPLVLTAISDADVDILYGPRNTRDEVAEQILNDLAYAEANIKPEGEAPLKNTVDLNVVRALISRFGLFEGTWRKYHGLGDETKYLTASANASEKLLQVMPNVHPRFEELFNSMNLSGVGGIILFKEYVLNQQTHNLGQQVRSSNRPFFDITKKGADMFLCTDGHTIWDSPLFEGEEDPYTEFRHRDKRMYLTITPPYEVVGLVNGDNKQWTFNSNPQDREYIDLLDGLVAKSELKKLPENNWNGFIQPKSPNFRDAGTQTLPWDPGYNVTATGYMMNKFFNNTHVNMANVDEFDQPVLRIGEIMLNYAEAKYELGQLNQNIVDMTINKLRVRGGVAPLTIGMEPADPKRDPSVSATLWEIRRERAVELMGEDFRFDDLRRWKKMDYAAQEKLGMYIVAADYNNKLPVQGGAAAGYISRLGVPPAFPEHYYLYPIPSNQIVLNPNIEQNPGWN